MKKLQNALITLYLALMTSHSYGQTVSGGFGPIEIYVQGAHIDIFNNQSTQLDLVVLACSTVSPQNLDAVSLRNDGLGIAYKIEIESGFSECKGPRQFQEITFTIPDIEFRVMNPIWIR